MRLIDSESLYQRFLDYKLKHPTKYTDIDEIRIVISDEPTVDVLEQIRAEIEFEVDHRTNMLCAEDVFEIIDKYMAESEDEGWLIYKT